MSPTNLAAKPLSDSVPVARRSHGYRRLSWAIFGSLSCSALWLVGAVILRRGPLDIETRALYRLQRFAIGHDWFADVNHIVSYLSRPPWAAVVAFAMVGIFIVTLRPRWAAPALVAAAIVGPLYVELKRLVARPRPKLTDPIETAGGYGYPSGHASVSAVAAGLMILVAIVVLTGWLRWTAITIAVLATVAVGFSRLALGVHSPTDILGGWLVAGALIFGVVAVAETLLPRFPDGRLSDGG